MTELYIGIDGGGTHTTALAVRPDGRITGRAEGPGLNYLNDGLACCVRRFRGITERLTAGREGARGTVCAGLAALDEPAEPEILSAFQSALPAGWRLMLESDLSVALAGFSLGKPGLMAVCGTGSMVLARDRQGRERTAGGWGWKVGDPGSGYTLAREGLARALFRREAEGRDSPLLAAALSYFGAADARGLIDPLYRPGAGPDVLAAFGAEVARLAEGGDLDAGEILREQMRRLAVLAAALLADVPEAGERIGLYGGLFQHSAAARSLFTVSLRAHRADAAPKLTERPPALGAVILAMLREGIHPDQLPDFTEGTP